MSKPPWLLFDCHSSLHRAFHAIKDVSFLGKGTGAVFGFLRDVRLLQERYGTERCAFTFDVGLPLRRLVWPGYKQRAVPAAGTVEKSNMDELRAQTYRLRHELLPAIGFKNVFAADGYEADDLLASVCLHNFEPYEDGCVGLGTAVVVSSDKDLYQLLSGRVRIWQPYCNREVTQVSFAEEYGIPPTNWATAKALAGEPPSGDNVPGIDGVGIATAVKWIKRELPRHHKTYKAIRAGQATVQRNLQLVSLPWPGTPACRLVEDDPTAEGWRRAAEAIGAPSLLGEREERYSGAERRK